MMKLTLSLYLILVTFFLQAQSFINHRIGSNADKRWVVIGDLDNNSRPDLLIGNMSNGTSKVYLNWNDTLILTNPSLGSFRSTRGISLGNYDNDCNLDILLANGGGGIGGSQQANQLYTGLGDGTFSFTSSSMGSGQNSSITASWGDYDADGHLDLYVANTNSGNNQLFQNSGTGSFTAISGQSLVTDGDNSSGGHWVDYDNDNDLDLYVTNSANQNNLLFRQDSTGFFTQITTGTIVTSGGNSHSASWGDYDNDGGQDVFVANTSNQDNQLYQNNGNGTFTRITNLNLVNDNGYSTCSSWGDLNNDGYLDLVVGNGRTTSGSVNANFVYINNGNGGFSTLGGDPLVNDWHSTYSVAISDLDRDGNLDVAFACRYEKDDIYYNQGNSNNYFSCELRGNTSNSSALGAKIKLKADLDSNGTSTWQYRELMSCSGSGQNGFDIHFGLKKATVIDSLEIRWPSGQTCTFTNLAVNGYWHISESNCTMDTIIESGFIDSSNYRTAFFTNTSHGPVTRYLWDFGDPNTNADTSNLPNPTYRYAQPGTYTVCLYTYDNVCKWDSSCTVLEVCPDTSNIGFVDTHQSLTVNFIDTSNSTAYDIVWDFGDNSSLGSGSSLSHTFATAGTYNVCLTLTDSCRTKNYCRQISVCADTIIAGFGFQGSGFTRIFNDSSVNAPTLNWNFGDGTSSSAASPAHTFVQPGTYYVCQTATDSCTSTTFCDTVKVCLDSLVANFNLGKTGKQVSFSDHSINANTYQWNFGDGNTSTQTSPNHTYATYGSYTACLVVTNDCFSDTLCEAINICPDTLEAGFGFNKSAYNVSFSDSSINASTINWDFGDGNSASGNSPSHTYSSPGAYYVCQTVTTLCDTNTFCDTVGICLDTAQADFSASLSGQIISFSNLSQNANTYWWDFGDGNTSTNPNPSHIYTNYGTYTVCLAVSNDCYSDTTCKTINVCANPGTAGYTFKDAFAPLAVQFTDASTNAVSYSWDFGDGSFSSNQNPLKVFADPIVYNVCLTITDSCGLQDSTCQSVDLTRFSVEELKALNAIQVYPNPTSGFITIENIEISAAKMQVELYTLGGELVMSSDFLMNAAQVVIDLENYPDGAYLLTIRKEGKIKSLIITKE